MISTDISIITHTPEGIARVAAMLPARIDGVRYVVSWQDHRNEQVPAELSARGDVLVVRFDESGLSRNRNNSLAHCSAELVIMTDDDVALIPEGIDCLRKLAEENPDVDLLTFRSEMSGTKRYPAVPTRLGRRWPKGYGVAAIEIAIRGRMTGKLRCCPELGLGAPRLQAGEDEMMVYGAIRRGVNCMFFPVTVARHHHDSTGCRQNPPDGVIMASGACIALMYPVSALLRIPLKAWRMFRGHGVGLFRGLKCLLKGAFESRGVLSRNHDTLW